jgi:hypothetical protein
MRVILAGRQAGLCHKPDPGRCGCCTLLLHPLDSCLLANDVTARHNSYYQRLAAWWRLRHRHLWATERSPNVISPLGGGWLADQLELTISFPRAGESGTLARWFPTRARRPRCPCPSTSYLSWRWIGLPPCCSSAFATARLTPCSGFWRVRRCAHTRRQARGEMPEGLAHPVQPRRRRGETVARTSRTVVW